MASEVDRVAVYHEDDDDDEEEPLNDVVLYDDDDSDDADTNSTSSAALPPVTPSSSSAVSIALLPPFSALNGSDPSASSASRSLAGVTTAISSATAVFAVSAPNLALAATPVSERKPIDDSRKLFQRLWTDEDEIELLQGFLEFNAHKGPNWSGHHHDTTAFYDQIKSKIQLDCNKSQMVEKLRRLKKKYRTVVGRMSSGKEVVFKSPHDEATFEISRKIWSNLTVNRPELDEDDQNPSPITATPAITTFHIASDHRTPNTGLGIDINSPDKMTTLMCSSMDVSRKRSRVKIEDKSFKNVVDSGGYDAAVNASAPSHGLVEETVRSCLSPLLKDIVENASSTSWFGVAGGSQGTGSLVSNVIPMNFPGVSFGNNAMDERWKKQQILELELYSERLELVQDEIKLALSELKSKGS